MRRGLRIVISGIVISYLGLCGSIYFLQRSLIYFPVPRSLDTRLLTLQADGASVLVSTRPVESPRALIYFGGNAEDVSLNMPGFAREFPDRAIYLMHYRGYGGSSGSPSQTALFEDGLALFDKVHASHQSIEVIGRSLGSGVAVYIASQRPVARLVLITPYDSLQELAARQFPYAPVRWLLRDKFESWRYAPRVTAPTTIVAAERDEVIPRESTELLRTRFKSGLVSYRVIAGKGHNTISESPDYLKLLKGAE